MPVCSLESRRRVIEQRSAITQVADGSVNRWRVAALRWPIGYDPGPGETDYSEQMTLDQFIKRFGPRKAKGGMVKGFSPIARPQRFKGVF